MAAVGAVKVVSFGLMFSPEILHNVLRSFQQQPPTTTLLVTNQGSCIVSLSRIPTPVQGTVKLTPSLPMGILPEGEQGRQLPMPPMSSSPKEISEGSITITESGFGPEPDKLLQESRAPSVSPVPTTGSHSSRHHRILSDQSEDSDDNQPPEGLSHSSPSRVCQKSHSPGYEPSSVTGHKPLVMTISASSAKAHNPMDTHPQMDSTLGSKQRSSSSDSSHEASVDGAVKKKKKKKHKRKKSGDKSPAPKVTSFTMFPPPDPMVKDYDTAGSAAPDQSNPKVIIIDEPSEVVEVSHCDR